MTGPANHPEATSGSLARALGAELRGPATLPLVGLETLERAGPHHLTFIRSREYGALWPTSRAGAALLSAGIEVRGHDPAARALLIVPDADLALIAALELFAPPTIPATPGIHPTAAVDPGASIDPSASIGPHCTIAAGSRIGPGASLGPGVRIGPGATIGAGCILHAGVAVQARCSLGDACILHPGVVIGADGFGYRPSADGRGLVKIPHIGNVEIGRAVEIGANSCVDRAKFGSTTIGDGTKIDNLVQIGHNCRIGRSCIICGLCGIAGSVTIGDGVVLAGQVGVADNATIGAGARIGAMSGVKGTVPPGESWVGAPARPAHEQMRNFAAGQRLADHVRTLRRLDALVRKAIPEADAGQ